MALTSEADRLPLLIHMALQREAGPLIARLGLKSRQVGPFPVFASADVVLIISGIGADRTRKALRYAFETGRYRGALNVGTAACTDSAVSIGTACTVNRVSGLSSESIPLHPDATASCLPSLPLKTVAEPWRGGDMSGVHLVDMEGLVFVRCAREHVPLERIELVKIVSDYGIDRIPAKDDVQRIMNQALEVWLPRIVSGLPERQIDTVQRQRGKSRQTTWQAIREMPAFLSLDAVDQQALATRAKSTHFTYAQLRQLLDMAIDFQMWKELPLSQYLSRIESDETGDQVLQTVREQWNQLKREPPNYAGFRGSPSRSSHGRRIVVRPGPKIGFGACPVASPRTRCCNLQTLDSVEGCAFDCSYCAIKTFYRPDEIVLNSDFARRLDALELDEDRAYHIGTGQSSDSLGPDSPVEVLEALVAFARRHPRVILELKTKSANVDWLLSQTLPENLLCTWTLNTPTLIDAEEHGTARLQERLDAAQQMAGRGTLIGFHFHPIVQYRNSPAEYAQLYRQVLDTFSPNDVVLISLGTLTFTRAVIRKLRRTPMRSKVLQMPLVEIAGKFSYPMEVKRQMFHHAYEAFSDWHDEVFFYLCMEDASLWPDVFGMEYEDNEAFERTMKNRYEERIEQRRAARYRVVSGNTEFKDSGSTEENP